MIGIIAALLYTLNLAFWTTILFITALFRAFMPSKKIRKKLYDLMQNLPTYWINGHDWIMRVTANIDWQIEGLEGLSKKEWYFLVVNHQSWVDILVLAKVFNHKIPPLKFFLKKQLIWLPFAGQACWLLDFPFMERHSKSFIKKHPHLKGKDIETARRACEKFKQYPSAIINFLEGTRFSVTKQQKQQSPYRHLLKPKSSGLVAALSVLEGYIRSLLDVTIIYPDTPPHVWDFFCGRIKKIVVKVRIIPIPAEFLKNFADDRKVRAEFQQWMNTLWEEKDKVITHE